MCDSLNIHPLSPCEALRELFTYTNISHKNLRAEETSVADHWSFSLEPKHIQFPGQLNNYSKFIHCLKPDSVYNLFWLMF